MFFGGFLFLPSDPSRFTWLGFFVASICGSGCAVNWLIWYLLANALSASSMFSKSKGISMQFA